MAKLQTQPDSLLDRLLTSIVRCLTPEVARRIADVKADEQTLSRLEELRKKANFGTLTEGERAEYEEFVEAVDLLAILKAKARAVVKVSR